MKWVREVLLLLLCLGKGKVGEKSAKRGASFRAQRAKSEKKNARTLKEMVNRNRRRGTEEEKEVKGEGGDEVICMHILCIERRSKGGGGGCWSSITLVI
jgi:hypothetical protein